MFISQEVVISRKCAGGWCTNSNIAIRISHLFPVLLKSWNNNGNCINFHLRTGNFIFFSQSCKKVYLYLGGCISFLYSKYFGEDSAHETGLAAAVTRGIRSDGSCTLWHCGILPWDPPSLDLLSSFDKTLPPVLVAAMQASHLINGILDWKKLL